MEYYTLKANKEFWMSFIAFRREWRGKYTMSDLAREIGFSASYLHEVMNNTHRGEISTRMISTMLKRCSVGFSEAFILIPVDCDRLYTPSRCREQMEHADPTKQTDERIPSAVNNPYVWRKKNNEQVKRHLTNVF